MHAEGLFAAPQVGAVTLYLRLTQPLGHSWWVLVGRVPWATVQNQC